MKKISAVLLVLALVGSAVFASFTGNAGVSFGVDLDGKSYGFDNTVELNAELNFFEKLVDKAGEGDIYAEIKAELTLGFDFAEIAANEYNPVGIDFDYDEALDEEENPLSLSGLVANVEITSAKIIGDNWFVGILGALGAPNFAVTAIEVNDDGDALLDMRFLLDKAPGLTVGFSDFEFGLGVKGTYGDDPTYRILLSALTPEFAFSDGLTGQFGVAGLLADDEMGVFGSVKVDFAQDDLAISLASDIQYVKEGTADGVFDAEVALVASYDFLTADVYFATNVFDAEDQEAPASYVGSSNILSVQLGAVIEGFDITVKGLDLVNQQDISAKVGYGVTDELSVAVSGGYIISGAAKGTWSAGAEAEYAADMFTVAAEVGLVGTDAVDEVTGKVTLSSEALVAGATLSLEYESGNFLANKLGKITAKAVVEF